MRLGYAVGPCLPMPIIHNSPINKTIWSTDIDNGNLIQNIVSERTIENQKTQKKYRAHTAMEW